MNLENIPQFDPIRVEDTGQPERAGGSFIELDVMSISRLFSLSNIKLSITKNFLEFYEYSIPLKQKKHTVGVKKIPQVSFKSKHNKKSFHLLRSLLFANFSQFDKFITLTFRDTRKFNISSLSDCNERKVRFLKKMALTCKDFKYIIVPELHPSRRYKNRKVWHYHLICNAPYMKPKAYQRLWPHGFSYVNAISSLRGGLSGSLFYVSKYISKNCNQGASLGARRFYASNNLDRPKIFRDPSCLQPKMDIISQGVKPLFTSSYLTPFNGTCYYSAYKIDRIEAYYYPLTRKPKADRISPNFNNGQTKFPLVC